MCNYILKCNYQCYYIANTWFWLVNICILTNSHRGNHCLVIIGSEPNLMSTRRVVFKLNRSFSKMMTWQIWESLSWMVGYLLITNEFVNILFTETHFHLNFWKNNIVILRYDQNENCWTENVFTKRLVEVLINFTKSNYIGSYM